MNSVDTCSPVTSRIVHAFRVYSIIFPVLLIILFFEAIFIFASIPTGDLGSALSIKGSLPALPGGNKLV